MLYNKLLILLASLLICFSCDTILEDDLGLKDYPDQTVVNASLQAGGTAKVFVSTSTNILGSGALNSIENATVTLLYKNNPVALRHYEKGIYGSDVNIEPMSTYSLVVDIPGEASITGTTHTPNSFELSKASGIDTLYISKSGEPISSFTLQWNDNALEENFYELLLYQIDSTGQPVMLDLMSNNLSVSNNTGSDVFGNDANTYMPKALLTDALFNGKSFTIQGQFIKAIKESKVVLHIKSLTPEYYTYLFVQNRAVEGQDELFTEPVTTPTNIEGAYGFMGGYYLIEKEI